VHIEGRWSRVPPLFLLFSFCWLARGFCLGISSCILKTCKTPVQVGFWSSESRCATELVISALLPRCSGNLPESHAKKQSLGHLASQTTKYGTHHETTQHPPLSFTSMSSEKRGGAHTHKRTQKDRDWLLKRSVRMCDRHVTSTAIAYLSFLALGRSEACRSITSRTTAPHQAAESQSRNMHRAPRIQET
jgi:hypothetical protein